MADILKEIIKRLPEKTVSEAAFEGANIVLYTKDRKFLEESKEVVRSLVEEFKKRVEIRPDPEITMNEDKAEEKIRKILPEEAGVKEIFFDSKRSRVVIHVEKPGLAIGQQAALLAQIRSETFWIPLIQRIPPLRSKLIESIRAMLYQESEARRKFLHKVGHRIYDGWLREKKHEWVRVSFMGGGRQVGRSCLFLQTPESRILLDCGIDVANDKEPYPYLDAPEFDVKELDAVIVSHSHLDHSGLIPYLFKLGYGGPIYCTAPTRDTMVLLQLDLIKIQRDQGNDPIYTTEEIKKMVMHTICLKFDEVTDITPDVRITFYNSGHILGSALTHMNIGNGLHNLVYTGDLKFGRTHLLEAADINFPRLETMVIESTYGGRDNVLPPNADSDEFTLEVIKDVIDRGGKVLMPVLGSGRAQEVMIIVGNLIKEGKLPQIPVYIDGLLWDITAIHTAYPEFLNRNIRKEIFHQDNNPFLSDIFKRIGSQKERMKVIEEEGACIILATSGMLQGGPSVEYFKNLASNKKNAMLFTCYQGEGSLGRRVQQGEREFSFREGSKNTIVKIEMEVKRLEITGHSDRRQLMNYISRCSPSPKRVIINHGEVSRSMDLASSVHKQFNIETIVPRNLDTIRIK